MTQDQEPIYHARPIRETGVIPETTDLITWYQERLNALGEMTTEVANATDGQAWKAELEGGEVKAIEGRFFVIRGTKVTTHNVQGEPGFSWLQPGIHQSEIEMTMPTSEGDRQVQTSGFVGAIRDEAGNVLLTLAQEPYARAPKKALFRTPVQASATKFKDLLAGDREKDPVLFDLIATLGGSTDISEMFRSGKIEAFPLPYADANRIDATNYGFSVTITDAEVRERLKNNGASRWCSPAEVREIMRAGLLNGHTVAAIFASAS